MNFKPTKEQERIFLFTKKRPENLLIKARAGSGKTSTAIECAKLLPKDKKIIFLAFNKHIQEELKTKLPDHVRCYTTYGLGMGALKRKYGDSILFDEFKADKIILKKSKSWGLNDEFDSEEEVSTYLNNIKKLSNLCRLTLTTKPDFIPYISERYNIPLNKPKDIKRVLKVLDEMTTNRKTFDYTDMIFLPAIDNSIWFFPQDNVFTDEAQDINKCQIKIIEKVLKRNRKTKKLEGRLFSFGDAHQCQPSGSKILLFNGDVKKIEDINIGDKVVTYDRHNRGHFIGYDIKHRWSAKQIERFCYCVDEISKRRYVGELVKIKSNGKESTYTPNHRCLVRINANCKNKFLLYLMEKDGYFKIGICPLWSKNNIDFSGNRVHQENVDNFWILKVYEKRQEAYYDEQYYSIMYGIPQMILTYRNQKRSVIRQNDIDNYYFRFSKVDLYEKAIKLLKLFHRDINYSFWNKNKYNYVSKIHMFETRACNIIPEIMQVCHFDETNTRNKKNREKYTTIIQPTYFNVDNVEYYDVDEDVYSLKINKHEVYVSDGILTHNSIYGFNAADEKSFQWFEKFPNTKVLPLTTSFRCSQAVIRKAQEIVPDVKALPDAPEGTVRDGNVLEEAQSGDFVLCRTTMPLVRLFFQLITQHKKAVIKGSDIGNNLIELIGENKNLEKLILYWENELKSFRNDLKKDGVLEPKEHSGYAALEDKVDTLLFLARISDSILDLKHKIKLIFTDKIQGIVLSTVHKIKGLEADRVFIIRPDLLPMQTPKAWQAMQEKNLEYVAVTRARLELIYDREWMDES
jgi:superfamily I DNA/RNA helicase